MTAPYAHPGKDFEACGMGYHQWYLGACATCEVEEAVHNNPLNCVYCNLVHVGGCYPDRDRALTSGWVYQPRHPEQATVLDRLPAGDTRRYLTEADLDWLGENGYSLAAHVPDTTD